MPAADMALADSNREAERPQVVLREGRRSYRITSLRREFQNGGHSAPPTRRRNGRRWKRRTGVPPLRRSPHFERAQGGGIDGGIIGGAMPGAIGAGGFQTMPRIPPMRPRMRPMKNP